MVMCIIFRLLKKKHQLKHEHVILPYRKGTGCNYTAYNKVGVAVSYGVSPRNGRSAELETLMTCYDVRASKNMVWKELIKWLAHRKKKSALNTLSMKTYNKHEIQLLK